jgi:hypothetical protein
MSQEVRFWLGVYSMPLVDRANNTLLKPGTIQQEIAVIRRIIVDPKDPDAFEDK